jgi:hypothetical protein
MGDAANKYRQAWNFMIFVECPVDIDMQCLISSSLS